MEKIFTLSSGHHIDVSRIVEVGPILQGMSDEGMLYFEVSYELVDSRRKYFSPTTTWSAYYGSLAGSNAEFWFDRAGIKETPKETHEENTAIIAAHDKVQADKFRAEYDSFLSYWKTYANAH